MPFEPGYTLAHYRLIEKIGEGRMGTVHRARDLKLERTVALRLLTHSSEDPEVRSRFLHDARTAAALTPPVEARTATTLEAEVDASGEIHRTGPTRDELHVWRDRAERSEVTPAESFDRPQRRPLTS